MAYRKHIHLLTPGLDCSTRWPIMLVHGVGFKRAERFRYFGDIPEALRTHGALVFISDQDAWGSTESNAAQLEVLALTMLEELNVEKINIIAHSKGGLDSRALISLPSMKGRVASLTTLSTPHKGSSCFNILPRIPDLPKRVLATTLDAMWIMLGDEDPSCIYSCEAMSNPMMRFFNERYPLPEDVYVQSFTSVLRRFSADMLFYPTTILIRIVEGPNDGLVAEAAAQFGDYRGVVNSTSDWGVSHQGIVDGVWFMRQRWPRRKDNFDIVDWWLAMVDDMRKQGF